MINLKYALLALLLLLPAMSMAAPPPVTVVVAGRQVALTPAEALQDGILMVPYRPVAEAAGARVTWDAESQTLRVVSLRGKTIVVRPGAQLVCDGQAQALPVPAQMIEGTLVGPLKPLAEALEGVLDWNEQKRAAQVSAKIVKLETRGDEQGVAVTAVTSLPSVGRMERMAAPPRVFFDLCNTYAGRQREISYVNVRGILRVRCGQFDKAPPVTRIVADLRTDGLQARFEPREDGCGGRLIFGQVQGDEPLIERAQPKLLRVAATSSGDDTAIITAYTSDPLQPLYDVLRRPYRVLLDLAGVDASKAEVVAPAAVPFVQDLQVVEQGRIVLYMAELVPFKIKTLADPDRVQITFQREKLAGKVIMVDAGHGGKDSGARGRYLLEKNVNLDVARQTAERLAMLEARPYLTRDTDVFIDLYARPRMTNELPADLFVSIHCNAFTKRDTGSGTQTYYTHPQSKSLAVVVQDALAPQMGREDDGVFHARFCVTRETQIPAVLVELLFIDNKIEENLLAKPEVRQKAAYGVAEGIRKYVEGTNTVAPVIMRDVPAEG